MEEQERPRSYLSAPETPIHTTSQRTEQASGMQVLLLAQDEELPTPPGHLPLLLPQHQASVLSAPRLLGVLALQSQRFTVPL